MLDFPSSPTNGQKFPVTPIPGVATYVWDSEKWTTLNPPSGTGVSQTYVDTQDNLRLAKAANLSDVADATTARKSVYAAPFDSLAYNGMQINGSMEVSQERGFSTLLVLGGPHFCDGWQAYKNGSMGVSVNDYAVSYVPGFSNFAGITVQTPQPTLTSNEYVFMSTNIEGYRTARLQWGGPNAQPITIGFWTRHVRPGTYTGSIRNVAVTRSYVFSYTQNVSDAPEYKTVTIPGCTDGVWEITNLMGLVIVFTMAAGPNIIASSLNTWLNVNALAGPGQINGVAATSDVFRIVGVVVLPGIEAPTASRSPFIMRPYDQELLTCQRYYEQSSPSAAYLANETSHLISIQEATVAQGQTFFHHTFGIPKRATPTVKPYPYATPTNTNCMSNNNGVDYPANSASPQGVNQRGFRLYNNSNTSLTISGMCAYVSWTADARL